MVEFMFAQLMAKNGTAEQLGWSEVVTILKDHGVTFDDIVQLIPEAKMPAR